MKRTNHAPATPQPLTEETIRAIDGDLLGRVLDATREQRYSVADVKEMATQVGKSNLCGMTEAQAFVLMMVCEAKGLHPIQAIERYHIIKGRHAMRAEAVLADMIRLGWIVTWITEVDDWTQQEANFKHPVKCPDGKNVRFAWKDAEQAEVTHGDNWRHWGPAMMRARVNTIACRMLDPGIIAGIYTTEEVMDFKDDSPARPAPRVEPQPIATPPPPKPSVKSECYAWIEKQVQAANDHWSSTLFIENKTSQYKPLVNNAWQCINGVVSQWIETGELDGDLMLTDGKRDRAKVKEMLSENWELDSPTIKEDVQEYLDAKLREAAEAAGVNLDTEPATPIEAP